MLHQQSPIQFRLADLDDVFRCRLACCQLGQLLWQGFRLIGAFFADITLRTCSMDRDAALFVRTLMIHACDPACLGSSLMNLRIFRSSRRRLRNLVSA